MRIIIIIALSIISMNAFSQLNMLGELMRGGIDDGQKLMKAYLLPYEKSLGYSATEQRNIYNKPQTDNSLKFSVGLNIDAIFIPSEDLSYDVNTLGLQRMEAADANNHISPTVFGDADKSVALKSKDAVQIPFNPIIPVATFNTPTGVGFGFLPIPELQFATTYKYSQMVLSGYFGALNDVVLIGYNISLHSQISSYFKKTKDLPIQFEVECGYGGSNQTVNLDVKPDAKLELLAKGPYTNQEFKLRLSGFNVGIGVNYRIKYLTAFVKCHYYSFGSRTQVNGIYPVNIKDPTGTIGLNIKDIKDPIDYSRDMGGFKLTTGIQLDIIEILYFKTSFTYAAYSNFNFGFGVRL